MSTAYNSILGMLYEPPGADDDAASVFFELANAA
jgi:hypothetical protein